MKTPNVFCQGAVSWELDRVVADLQKIRDSHRTDSLVSHGGRELPSPIVINDIIRALARVMFPMHLGPADLRCESENYYVGSTLDAALNALQNQVYLELCYRRQYQNAQHTTLDIKEQAIQLVLELAKQLPHIRQILDTDALAAYHGDPAALGVDEVILCYPGMLAIIYHRIAHCLYKEGLTLLARIISEQAHSMTGIDIHPGAQIGNSFFIDHGTGVVIGETCIIGEHVRIYQAVTLGAKRFIADESGILQKGYPRHPIVEDDVVIYAGATILGRVTIGKGSIIGGNVWLTDSVPAGANVSQACAQNKGSI